MDLKLTAIGKKVSASADVCEYIKGRLDNCLCEAEFYGIDAASWTFLLEMAELAGCNMDEMVKRYNF